MICINVINQFQLKLRRILPFISSAQRLLSITFSPAARLGVTETHFVKLNNKSLKTGRRKRVVITTASPTGKRAMYSSGGVGLGGRPKIILFYGSTREGRYVDRVGEFLQTVVVSSGMEPIVFDPLEMPFEMLKRPMHYYPEQSKVPVWMREANNQLLEADGFLLICTEYNCLPPGALTNMISHFPKSSYLHKPAGLVHYAMGAFGGCRSATLLKPFISEVGMVLIPSYVAIPEVHNVFDDNGSKCNNPLVIANVKKLMKELHWYAKGLKKLRTKDPPPQ